MTQDHLTKTTAETLLAWYDRHHRTLPWRISPADRRAGAVPDPYRVWLSEVMLQQTTVATVVGYFEAFLARWPNVEDLANAPNEDVMAAWAGLGYYSRARNLHACAKEVVARGGFPKTAEELIDLPGIGPYTAAAIAAIAFDEPAAVMDGNVERVMARLFAVSDPLPNSKESLRAHASRLTPRLRPGDYAQAVMDLGATICTPRRPACVLCCVREACKAHSLGIAETLPRKAPKKVKPIRTGEVYIAQSSTHVLTVRRPNKGLLGGMLALPSTDWAETAPNHTPPFDGTWIPVGEVRHTFTHFHLKLRVFTSDLPPCSLDVVQREDAESAMPTVFAKALRLANPVLKTKNDAT
ncbi:MAG: A/G-specific adenine glycosylase [Pseudomonadota bacterium]